MGDASTALTPVISTPCLESGPGGHRLLVHGEPFLILGAELQNSSFSCPEHMQCIWPKLKHSNVNTVLANVAWEVIEPQEGVFDFTKLDQLVLDARRHGLHLILLWFGAFKNGKSTYAPAWVKTNMARFPRAALRMGKGRTQITDALSIFDSDAVEADAAAFRFLMRHIKEIDEDHSTILMVQVENEVGLLGDSRDGCAAANERFESAVPQDLLTMLSETWQLLHPSLQSSCNGFQQKMSDSGTFSWTQAFGNSLRTDELFMAYHYARYVEQVARAGRAEYTLPMFTNVWQNYADEDADKSQPVVVGGGGEPGDYPSGGAVINVLDIWYHFAPSLDFIAPDVYLNDYDAVCKKYRHRGNPLFIPEQRRDEYGARRIWSAYGTHHALCASPFGIDTLNDADSPWRKHYRILGQASRYVLAAQIEVDTSIGFFFDDLENVDTTSHSITAEMGEWRLTIERSFVFGKPSPGFGMVIHLAEARFMLLGEGFQVRFTSTKPEALFTGILSFVEKVSDDHAKTLRNGRILNGDETRSGEVAIMPSANPDYGNFPICVTVPAKTGIAECEVYALP